MGTWTDGASLLKEAPEAACYGTQKLVKFSGNVLFFTRRGVRGEKQEQHLGGHFQVFQGRNHEATSNDQEAREAACCGTPKLLKLFWVLAL